MVSGYESGQISGFLAMDDFLDRFGENGQFSATRSGAIVGLLAYVPHLIMLCSLPYIYLASVHYSVALSQHRLRILMAAASPFPAPLSSTSLV